MTLPLRLVTSAVALAILLNGCRPEPREAVIGLALQPADRNIGAARLAESTLADEAGPGDISIRLVLDTTIRDRDAESELLRARSMLALPALAGVVGHSSSRGALAAAPFYDSAGVPVLTAIATSRLLRQSGPAVFQLPPDDSVQGAFIGRFVHEGLHAFSAAVLYQNDEYGMGLRDGILAALRGRGVVVTQSMPFSIRSDLDVLTRAALAGQRLDVLIVAGRADQVADVATAARDVAPRAAVVAGDAPEWPELVAQVEPVVLSRLYLTSLWLYPPGDSLADDFVTRFRQASHREPEPYDALTYDAVMLLGRGIREVGPSPRRLMRWLRSAGTEHPAIRLVTGEFPPSGPRDAHLRMTQWRDGAAVLAWPR